MRHIDPYKASEFGVYLSELTGFERLLELFCGKCNTALSSHAISCVHMHRESDDYNRYKDLVLIPELLWCKATFYSVRFLEV